MKRRMSVRVMVLNKDETNGQFVVVERGDMGFTVLVKNSSEGPSTAKSIFAKKYGPDLTTRSCNLQSKDCMLLYCMPKELHPRNVKARDLPFARPARQAR